MSIPIRRAEPSDFDAIFSLLTTNDLPTAGLEEGVGLVLVAVEDDDLVACAALETNGSDGLLRSLAVASAARGSGLGTRIVGRMEEEARRLGLRRLFLLTETAEGFFERLGYERIDRELVPKVVRTSAEFSACVSAGATAMHRNL